MEAGKKVKAILPESGPCTKNIDGVNHVVTTHGNYDYFHLDFYFWWHTYFSKGTCPIQKEHLMPAEMRKELCALFKSMIACWEVDEPKPQDIAQLFEKTRDFCKQIPC